LGFGGNQQGIPYRESTGTSGRKREDPESEKEKTEFSRYIETNEIPTEKGKTTGEIKESGTSWDLGVMSGRRAILGMEARKRYHTDWMIPHLTGNSDN
jgi:hypothetical protein